MENLMLMTRQWWASRYFDALSSDVIRVQWSDVLEGALFAVLLLLGRHDGWSWHHAGHSWRTCCCFQEDGLTDFESLACGCVLRVSVVLFKTFQLRRLDKVRSFAWSWLKLTGDAMNQNWRHGSVAVHWSERAIKGINQHDYGHKIILVLCAVIWNSHAGKWSDDWIKTTTTTCFIDNSNENLPQSNSLYVIL